MTIRLSADIYVNAPREAQKKPSDVLKEKGFSALLEEQISSHEDSPIARKKVKVYSPAELREQQQVKAKEAEKEFLRFAKMSPEERMRAQILAELGLTEDQLAALPPNEREKIEARILDHIKRKFAQEGEQSAYSTVGEAPEILVVQGIERNKGPVATEFLLQKEMVEFPDEMFSNPPA